MSYREFVADEKTMNAVFTKLIQIAENSKKLIKNDEEFPDKHPEIEWKKIVGMRNKLVHEYDIIDPARVWAAYKKLDELLDVVEREIFSIHSKKA